MEISFWEASVSRICSHYAGPTRLPSHLASYSRILARLNKPVEILLARTLAIS